MPRVFCSTKGITTKENLKMCLSCTHIFNKKGELVLLTLLELRLLTRSQDRVKKTKGGEGVFVENPGLEFEMNLSYSG